MTLEEIVAPITAGRFGLFCTRLVNANSELQQQAICWLKRHPELSNEVAAAESEFVYALCTMPGAADALLRSLDPEIVRRALQGTAFGHWTCYRFVFTGFDYVVTPQRAYCAYIMGAIAPEGCRPVWSRYLYLCRMFIQIQGSGWGRILPVDLCKRLRLSLRW